MRVYARTDRKIRNSVQSPSGPWRTVTVSSLSDPSKAYTIDITHGRCSCPAWIYQKGGDRFPCKHLRALGFKYLIDATQEVNVKTPATVKTPAKVKVNA